MTICLFFFFFNDTATTEIYTLSLHDALPISTIHLNRVAFTIVGVTPVDYLGTLSTVPVLWAPVAARPLVGDGTRERSEEHTSELQSRLHLVCRLLLEKKKHNVHLQ